MQAATAEINEMRLDEVRSMVARMEASSGRDFSEITEYVDWLETEQDPVELAQMISVAKGKKSFLEIGSRFGGTLLKVAKSLAPKSLVVSVDYPAGDLTPCPNHPKAALEDVAGKIRALGHACHLIDADSQRLETVAKVKAFGEFDFVFIDADHSYEGVKKDWENYGPLGKVVGFHDIAGEDEGCVRFWNELKAQYRHAEFVNTSGKRRLGIGIIYK